MASVAQTDKQEYTGGDVGVVEKGARTQRTMFTGLAMLLAALVGFGIGWLAFRDSGGVDVPADVDQLIVDYTSAWINADGDAAVELMTDGGVHVSPTTGPAGISGEELATAIGLYPRAIENVETFAVLGDLPYVVVQSADVGNQPTYSVFEITEQFGELRIASQHVYFY